MAVKVWMQPDAPASEAKWTAHGEMILGGRYLRMSQHGEMMSMPYDVVTIGAYDNHLKTFISIWIDNLGTAVYQGTGVLDDTKQVLTQSGEMYDAMMGHNMDMRTVTTYINENRFTVVMYHAMGNQEFKSMEMVYSRKK